MGQVAVTLQKACDTIYMSFNTDTDSCLPAHAKLDLQIRYLTIFTFLKCDLNCCPVYWNVFFLVSLLPVYTSCPDTTTQDIHVGQQQQNHTILLTRRLPSYHLITHPCVDPQPQALSAWSFPPVRVIGPAQKEDIWLP